MTLFTKLIVPLDGSQVASRALPVAQILASQLQVPTTLISFAISDESLDLARERLDAAVEGFPQGAEVRLVRTKSVRTSLTTHLTLTPERHGLVVMATHALGPITEMLLGSVADDVVRQSPLPVVLVGPRVDPNALPGHYDELVACVDGGPADDRLVPLLTVARSELALRPKLIQVVTSTRRGPDGTPDVILANPVERMAKLLDERDIAVDWEVLPGDDIAATVTEYAAERHAILALATRGRDPLQRLREASTALSVVRHATDPVIIFGPST